MLSWWQLIKGGGIFLALGSLLIGILVGFSAIIKDGNFIPLADNTIGSMLEGDNKAYQMEKDIVEGKFNELPDVYKDELINAMWVRVFTYMFLSIFFIVLLFKFFSWLSGQRQFEPGFDIWNVVMAVAVYVFLTVFYTFAITWVKSGQFTINKYVLMSAVPLKSVVYFFYKLPTLIMMIGI